MPVVQTDFDGLQWPPCCCGCAKPLKILGFDKDDRTIKLKFRSGETARQLRAIRRGGARQPSSRSRLTPRRATFPA